MKQISLSEFTGDWRGILSYVERSGEPVALYWNDCAYGVLLPPTDAARLIKRYDDQARAHAQHEAAVPDVAAPGLPTYLELLRSDPSLVPVVDGQRLQFMTMTNTSFVDPQQMYQFLDPRNGRVYVYRAEELQQAIGRPFAKVEFIPANPRAFVEGRDG